ncbi:MAG TPA: TM1812 family CRISPR-associated protein, partial [Thermotogota bacterium]|nr:TM1812 family CRISPR-associated protein [Thermotogota bacterium]
PIEILDWDNATREFLDHGNGRFFAEKLMANYQTVMAQVPDKEKRKYSPWKLVANKFGEFSQAFEEGDFVGVGLVANALEKMLQGESFQASLGALNFGWVTRALVEQILPSLQKVAIDARRKEEVPLDRKELARQLQLLRWYQEIQNIPNMLQGLREFMVNLVLFQNQEGNWLDLETRGKAEEKWNGHLKESEEKRIPLPDNSSLRLWDSARSLRNFISHCGLKRENRPGVDLSFLHSFLDREIDAWLNGAAHPFESWEEV